jgi:hypothetical protein
MQFMICVGLDQEEKYFCCAREDNKLSINFGSHMKQRNVHMDKY